MLADNPNQVSGLKYGTGRRVFDRCRTTLDADDKAFRLVADARFLDGKTGEARIVGDDELLEVYCLGTFGLLLLDRLLVALFDIVAELLEVVVGPNDNQFVKGIEAFVSAGDVDALLAPDDGYDIDIALLAEVQFLQRLARAGRILVNLEVRQVEVALEEVVGETLVDGGVLLSLVR